MDDQEPVVVYTVNDPIRAELLRNVLQEEGIVAEISGESQAGLSGVLQIEILTKAADAERARQIIEDLAANRGNEPIDDDED
jgi:hypothetical protein